MWHVMETAQQSHDLSERLVRAISYWTLADPRLRRRRAGGRRFAGGGHLGVSGGGLPPLLGSQQQEEEEEYDVIRLLDRGADVNRLHGTLLPLHCACMVGDAEMLELLLSRGARVNQVDGYGRIALHYAAERCADCVSLLLAHAADPNCIDGRRAVALHWAACQDMPDCITALLRAGACVDASDANGDTPLAWAARKGNVSSLRALLDYNATPDTINSQGLSPLDLAVRRLAGQTPPSRDLAPVDLLLAATACRLDEVHCGHLAPGGDAALWDALAGLCGGPRPLKQLCRRTIRRSFGLRRVAGVAVELPLPGALQQYVCLQ